MNEIVNILSGEKYANGNYIGFMAVHTATTIHTSWQISGIIIFIYITTHVIFINIICYAYGVNISQATVILVMKSQKSVLSKDSLKMNLRNQKC